MLVVFRIETPIHLIFLSLLCLALHMVFVKAAVVSFLNIVSEAFAVMAWHMAHVWFSYRLFHVDHNVVEDHEKI